MAWTAKVKDKEKGSDGTYRFVIVLRDGNGVEKQMEFHIHQSSQTLQWLKDNLNNEVSNLSNLDPNVTGLQKNDFINLA